MMYTGLIGQTATVDRKVKKERLALILIFLLCQLLTVCTVTLAAAIILMVAVTVGRACNTSTVARRGYKYNSKAATVSVNGILRSTDYQAAVAVLLDKSFYF